MLRKRAEIKWFSSQENELKSAHFHAKKTSWKMTIYFTQEIKIRITNDIFDDFVIKQSLIGSKLELL